MKRALLILAIAVAVTSCAGVQPPASRAEPKAKPSTVNTQPALSLMLAPTLPAAESSSAASGLYPVSAAFLPDGEGVVSVTECKEGSCFGAVWTTTTLGKAWTKDATGLPPFRGVSIVPGGGIIGVAASDNGSSAAYLEPSPGAPWAKIFTAPNGTPGLQASFSSPTDGYMLVTGQCATQQCGLLVYRTTDAGKTWTAESANRMWSVGTTPQPALGTIPLSEPGLLANLGSGRLALFSANPLGQVAVSSDGARSFQVTLSVQQSGGTASMTPSGNGWLAFVETCSSQTGACPTVLEHTTDGGSSWAKVGETSSPVGWLGIATAPDGSPWAITSGATSTPEVTTLSVNAGTVSLDAHPLPGGVTPSALMPLSATAAVALVDGPPAGALLLTRDGGKDWSSIASFPAPPMPSVAMGMWTKRTGWGLGMYSGRLTFLTTSDGGASWSSFGPVPEAFPASIAWGGFIDQRDGWIASPSDLWVTSDGGGTWTKRTLPPGFLVSVSFQSPTDGTEVLVPASAKSQGSPKALPHELTVTTDGGASWRIVLKTGALAGAFTPSGSLLATVRNTSGALVRLSSDGGATWRTVGSIEGEDLPTALGVASDGTLWAASYDRIWLWPKDGQPVDIAFDQTVLQGPPAVISSQDIEVLADGAIDATTDGGRTWSLIAAPPPASF